MYLSRWLWVALGLCLWRQTLAEKDLRDIRNNRNALPVDSEKRSSGDMAAILDRLTSLDRTVGELKDQMAQLLKISSDGGILKVLQDLQGVCEELSASQAGQQTPAPASAAPEVMTTTDSGHGQSHKCPQHQESGQLRLTAVMKEETETGYKVTVCYVAPEKPKVYRQLLRNGKAEPIEHHETGIITVERNKSQTHEPAYLGLDFTLQSKYLRLTLMLDENSPDEVHLPNIQMKVEPGHEIIYTPGSDVDIKFHIVNEMDEKMAEYKYNMTSVYLKSNTEEDTVNRLKLVPNLDLPEELSDIQFTEISHSEENKTQLLHVPYSFVREGGVAVFQMVALMNCSQKCLVEFLMLSQHIVFYPDDHSGPYPENFVGFISSKFPQRKSEEAKEVKCYEENRVKNCLLHCVAAGDDPTVTITRADQSPTSPHTNNVYDDTDYFASAAWDFENPTMEDAGDYLCQARSRDGSHVITQTMTMSVGRVAEIVRHLTRVTVQNETLLAECTAQGVPAPTVRFGPYYDSDPTAVINAANVTMTPINDTTTQATFLLPDWRQYNSDDIDNIYCFAENIEYSSDIEHIIVDDYK